MQDQDGIHVGVKMKTFEEYLDEMCKRQKYIEVVYDENTQEKLHQWCKENGIKHTLNSARKPKKIRGKHEFHTTVIYSNSLHEMENEVIDTKGVSHITGFEMLGADKDIPTFRVESKQLIDIRKEYQSKYDMKDDWPSYKPHVTITYDTKVLNLDSLPLPDFNLHFNTIRISDVTS